MFKQRELSTRWIVKRYKGTVVNQTFSSLPGGEGGILKLHLQSYLELRYQFHLARGFPPVKIFYSHLSNSSLSQHIRHIDQIWVKFNEFWELPTVLYWYWSNRDNSNKDEESVLNILTKGTDKILWRIPYFQVETVKNILKRMFTYLDNMMGTIYPYFF